MPTHEERITALEQTTREYRPVLQNFAYELTMVKGLIIEQTGITQELRADINVMNRHLGTIDTRLDALDARMNAFDTRLDALDARLHAFDTHFDALETRLDRIELLLTQVLTRLPHNP